MNFKTALVALSLLCGVAACDTQVQTPTMKLRGSQSGQPTPECPDPCTRTQGYWSTHNSAANSGPLQQLWSIPEGTLLCGQTWLDVLQGPTEGDKWTIIAQQYIAAMLNVAAFSPGGDVCQLGGCPGLELTPEVADALLQAKVLLETCNVTDKQWVDFAEDVKDVLDTFNNGFTEGAPHCDGGDVVDTE